MIQIDLFKIFCCSAVGKVLITLYWIRSMMDKYLYCSKKYHLFLFLFQQQSVVWNNIYVSYIRECMLVMHTQFPYCRHACYRQFSFKAKKLTDWLPLESKVVLRHVSPVSNDACCSSSSCNVVLWNFKPHLSLIWIGNFLI